MWRVVRLVLYFVLGVFVGVLFFSSFASAQATQSYQATYSVTTATGHVSVVGKAAAQAAAVGSAAQTFVGTTPAASNYEPIVTVYTQGSFVWSSDSKNGSQQMGCSFGSNPVQYNGNCFSQNVSFVGCTNGGVFNSTTYPGWCIVNGQPPPASGTATPDACKTFASTSYGEYVPQVYTDDAPASSASPGSGPALPLSSLPAVGAPATYDSENLSGDDPFSGCGLVEVGPRTHPLPSSPSTTVVMYKATGAVATGSITTDGQAAGTPAIQQCDAANFCLNGNEILAQPGTAQDDSQATINGQPISVPSSIPDNTCVSLSSGGVFCAADAVQPNNGASPPAPATPDDQVVTTGPNSQQIVDNYYDSTTVEQSTNYGNGKPSTSSGSSTTTTCTTSGGTQTCTSATSATTARSATTYATPVFPGGTSVNASVASAAGAIASSPLVTAAAGAIAQSVPAGSCPDWSFHSVLFNQTFDFSNGQAGICTFAATYGPTLTVVFAVMWVVLGAVIILSA